MFEDSVFVRLLKSCLLTGLKILASVKALTPLKTIRTPLPVYILFDKHLGMGDMLMISPLMKCIVDSPNYTECNLVTSWPRIVDLDMQVIPPDKFQSFLNNIEDYSCLIISPTFNSRHSKYFFKKQYILGYFSGTRLFSNFTRINYSYNSKGSHYLDRVEPIIRWLSKKEIVMSELYPSLLYDKYPLEFAGQDYVVIAPYVRVKGRQWDKYVDLVKYILTKTKHIKVVIIGSADDEEVEYNKSLLISNRVVDLTGKTTLREMIGVIKGGAVFISNDSGPAHASYFFSCISIVIFGAVSPDTRLPLGMAGNYAVYNSNVCKFFPCHDTMHRPSCVNKEKYLCIKSINVSDVASVLDKYLVEFQGK